VGEFVGDHRLRLCRRQRVEQARRDDEDGVPARPDGVCERTRHVEDPHRRRGHVRGDREPLDGTDDRGVGRRVRRLRPPDRQFAEGTGLRAEPHDGAPEADQRAEGGDAKREERPRRDDDACDDGRAGREREAEGEAHVPDL
jgi:hypothetical protein